MATHRRAAHGAGINGRDSYVRVLKFDGRNLTFGHNPDITIEETFPLDPAYHPVARRLQKLRLCRVLIVDGVIILLAPTRQRVP